MIKKSHPMMTRERLKGQGSVNNMKEALKESERKLLTLMGNLPGMVYRCLNTPDWPMQFTSHGALELTGYSSEEFTGKNAIAYNDLIHLDDQDVVWKMVQTAVKKKEPFTLQYRIITKSNEEKWVWEQGRGVFNDRGKLISLEGFITDISERKQAEEMLRESEKRGKRMRSAIVELTLEKDSIDADLQSSFKKVCEVLSKTIDATRTSVWKLSNNGEELLCLNLYEADKNAHSHGAVLHVRDFPKYFSAIKAESRISADDVQNDPRTNELTENYLKPLGIISMLDAGIVVNGELIGVICSERIGKIRKWYSDEGSFVGTIATFVGQLIVGSERKKVEEKLKESEKKSRAWLEFSPVCTKIVDLDFNLKYMSEAGIKGLKMKDVTSYYGKPYPFDFYSDSVKREIIKNLKKVKKTNEVIEQEVSAFDMEGNALWFHSTFVPVHNDKGQIDYIIVVSTDITQRKIAEKALKGSESELRKQKHVLEQKNAALKEILEHIENEKQQIKDDVIANIDSVVLPSLEKLKLKGGVRKHVNMIENYMEDLASSFGKKITDKSANLTSREVEICGMVKTGLANKETAKLLSISLETVEKHRRHIRKKLGISKKDINLTTYLRTF